MQTPHATRELTDRTVRAGRLLRSSLPFRTEKVREHHAI